MYKRIRKAVVGGFWGGVSAVFAGATFTGAPTRDQIGQLLGTFVVAAAVTGFAVWKAKPNAPALDK